MRRIILLLSILLWPIITAAQCSPTQPESLAGPWGGEHIGLVVSDQGAEVEYDCAHGRITEPLRLDRSGRFDVAGVHIREHGGPVREGEIPDEHPARYSGRVRGATMTLTVRLTDLAETIGTFRLERGAPARVFKCL